MPLPSDTLAVNHAKVNLVPDDPDEGQVRPSDWNANHLIVGFGVISADCTLTVGASGCDYTSVVTALAALKNYWISPGATVTISVADGTYAETPLLLNHPCGQSIVIQPTSGAPAVKALSSIVSSSGAAGDWNHVLQLDSNAGIAVGNFAVIEAPSGGVNPLRVVGLAKITNVGAGNQITINTKHRNPNAASGAVTSAAVRILRVVLQPSTVGAEFVVVPPQCSGGTLKWCVVDGAGLNAGVIALRVGAGARLQLGISTGIWAPGDRQAAVANEGDLSASAVAVVGGYNAGTPRYGVWTSDLGRTRFSNGMVTGANYGVVSTGCGNTQAEGVYATGNAYGANAYGNGRVWVSASYSTRMTDNTSAATYADNADCKISLLG